MSTKRIKEGLADLASIAESDHEVQMARAELYKIAKYAIKLHSMLKNVSEAEGIEAWQQAKITKAADYVSSVFHALEHSPTVVSGSNTVQLDMSEADVTKYKNKLSRALDEAKKSAK